MGTMADPRLRSPASSLGWVHSVVIVKTLYCRTLTLKMFLYTLEYRRKVREIESLYRQASRLAYVEKKKPSKLLRLEKS